MTFEEEGIAEVVDGRDAMEDIVPAVAKTTKTTTKKTSRKKVVRKEPFDYREVDIAKRPPGSVPMGLAPDEMIVDLFCGAGGASEGIRAATGRNPDIAVNHNPTAIAVHEANHPSCKHYKTGIWSVSPLEATSNGCRKVGLLWASPDCRSHSKAKGGKPRSKGIRDLAWVVIRWAKAVRPRIIHLENVEEFRDWGGLHPNGMPNADLKGNTFAHFVSKLERLGYRVEYRMVTAALYGTPTIRKRLFIVARCDGLPILWPAPTHGDPAGEAVRSGTVKPWRSTSEIIDWKVPCHSIFLTKVAARKVGVKRPLADNTLMRIAKGVKRYVIDSERPFLVSLTHQGGDRNESIDAPLRTLTAANRGEKALCDVERHGSAPFLAKFRFDSEGASIEAPLPTITANSFEKRPGGATPLGLVSPETTAPITMPYYATGVCASTREPLRTITTEDRHALIAPIVSSYYGEGDAGPSDRCSSIEEPVRTITTENRFALLAPVVTSVAHGDSGGRRSYEMGEPLGTQTRTNTHALTACDVKAPLEVAPVVTYAQQGGASRPVEAPLHTVTASRKDQNSLIGATLSRPLEGADDMSGILVPRYGERPGQEPRSQSLGRPMPTIVPTGNEGSLAAVAVRRPAAASVIRHYGKSVGSALDEPVGTVTAGGGGKTGLVVTPTTAISFVKNNHGDKPMYGAHEPMHTVVAGGTHHMMSATELAMPLGDAAAFMAQQNTGMVGHSMEEPLSTIVGKGSTQTPVAVHMSRFNQNGVGSSLDDPLETVMAGATRHAIVASHVINMKGTDQRSSAVDAPMPTQTSQGNHIGTVDAVVAAPADPDGEASMRERYRLNAREYALARRVAEFLRERGCWDGGAIVVLRGGAVLRDILLRMLTPAELAGGQGFCKSYVLDPWINGKPITTTAQVQLIGNSVCPQVACAIVHANANLAATLDVRELYRPWGEALKARLIAQRAARGTPRMRTAADAPAMAA